jgi:thiol:disulfide interchange protein
MKTINILLLNCLFVLFSFSQTDGDRWQDKISWRISVEKIDSSHAYIVLTAKLADGFHVFSVNHDPKKADFTGIPTSLNIKGNKNFKPIGKIKDGSRAHTVNDELGTQIYFEGTGVFKQEIEVLTDQKFKIPFEYSFQICNKDGCIFPPEQEASVLISGYNPSKQTDSNVSLDSVLEKSTIQTKKPKVNKKTDHFKTNNGSSKKSGSNLVIFLAGFIAGLVALFTPCMFPMIPMTVTFFTKQSKTRKEGVFKALIYGASIIFIYVTFGILFTAATGPMGLE